MCYKVGPPNDRVRTYEWVRNHRKMEIEPRQSGIYWDTTSVDGLTWRVNEGCMGYIWVNIGGLLGIVLLLQLAMENGRAWPIYT